MKKKILCIALILLCITSCYSAERYVADCKKKAAKIKLLLEDNYELVQAMETIQENINKRITEQGGANYLISYDHQAHYDYMRFTPIDGAEDHGDGELALTIRVEYIDNTTKYSYLDHSDFLTDEERLSIEQFFELLEGFELYGFNSLFSYYFLPSGPWSMGLQYSEEGLSEKKELLGDFMAYYEELVPEWYIIVVTGQRA